MALTLGGHLGFVSLEKNWWWLLLMVIELLFFSIILSFITYSSSSFFLLASFPPHLLSLPFLHPPCLPALGFVAFSFLPLPTCFVSYTKNFRIRKYMHVVSSVFTDLPISWKVLPTYPSPVWDCLPPRQAGECWVVSVRETSFLYKLAFPWSLLRLSMFPEYEEFLVLRF